MPEVNPVATVMQMTGGFILSRCLTVVANLGVADALDDTPRTAAELADLVGAHPDALKQVMRLLASQGMFELQNELFSHTPASRLLRSDHPQSMRPFVQFFGSPLLWSTYEQLEFTVRTNHPATEKSAPDGFWNYMQTHPDEGQIFNQTMVSKSRAAVAGVAANYDFSSFNLICDVGGGLGHLLSAVVNSTPNVKGILFDLPHVLKRAEGIASDRITLQAGNFFSDHLPAADAYLLMDVIHDWGDEQAKVILKAIRQAAPAHAKLLVIEGVLPETPGPSWVKVMDVQMLTLFGARQRTQAEHQILLESAGFMFQRVIPTGAEHSIVEATVVE